MCARFIGWLAVAVVISLVSAPARGDYLVLRDGTTVAGTVGADAATIEVQTLDGMMSVAPDDVAVRESAASLRATLRTLSVTAHERGPNALVQLVLWCRDKGLFAEMMNLADEVLAARPADARIIKLLGELADRDITAALLGREASSDQVACLRLACDKGPARRALARELLARLPPETRQSCLLVLLSDHRAEVRELAAKELKDARPAEALEPLIGASLFDTSREVRQASLQAVLAYHHPGTAAPYARALAHERESVRLAAIDALEAVNNPLATGALVSALAASSGGGTSRGYVSVGTQTSYVSDFDVEIAQGAAIAKPIIGVIQHGAVLDAKVIGAFASRSLTERQATQRALRSLTGQNFGSDVDKWRTWWLANRVRLSAAAAAPAPATTPGS